MLPIALPVRGHDVADHLQRSAIWPKQNHLTILPRIVFMSACVNARRVCVRTFPRAPVLNPSAVMDVSSGVSTTATASYSPSVQNRWQSQLVDATLYLKRKRWSVR